MKRLAVQCGYRTVGNVALRLKWGQALRNWNFEQELSDEPLDETGINLRAYFDQVPDEKIQQYNSDWTDEQTIEWDNNFRDDGNLMLLCCERDVDIREYRRVLEKCIHYRNRLRR